MKKANDYSFYFLFLLLFSCKGIQPSTSINTPTKPVIKKKIAHYWVNMWGDTYQQDTFLWTWVGEYDKSGNLIKHAEADKYFSDFKYDQNDSLVYYLKTTFPRASKNHLESKVSPPLDSMIIEINRNDIGLRETFSQTKIAYASGQKKTQVERVTYKHDTQNRKTEALHIKPDGVEELRTYQYEDQRMITRINYKAKNKETLCANVDTSFFDERGLVIKTAQASNCNPVKSKQFYSCNNCWIYRNYDEHKNLDRLLRVSFEGDTISGYQRKFDERNEAIWSESFNAKGETVRNDFVVEKILNEQGDCTFFKVTENGEVLRAEKFEYEYWPK